MLGQGPRAQDFGQTLRFCNLPAHEITKANDDRSSPTFILEEEKIVRRYRDKEQMKGEFLSSVEAPV